MQLSTEGPSIRPVCGGKAQAIAALLLALLATACNPVVKVEAPDKPIVINMNLNIRQEVFIRLEKDVEALLDKDDKLF